MRKRVRFRTNLFYPKIDPPLSFAMTADGQRLLRDVQMHVGTSLGDLFEYLVRVYGPTVTRGEMELLARENRRTQRGRTSARTTQGT